METWPAVPVGTMTRFGTVSPGVQLRLDANGREVPVGNTVKTPLAVWSTAVTLRTTALTPLAGTPPAPSTCTFKVVPAASVDPAFAFPLFARVSAIRAGTTGVNSPALPPLGGAK